MLRITEHVKNKNSEILNNRECQGAALQNVRECQNVRGRCECFPGMFSARISEIIFDTLHVMSGLHLLDVR
jgi:hypothetical protein